MEKIIVFLILAGAIFWAFGAQASPTDNVSGYAWSENIGWISFNCTNTNSCASVNYGVNINPSNGNFSGYAWSENIGWINFAPVGPYPNPPNNSADVNLNNFEVSGWVRAVSYGGGWNGWIKMRCQGGECNTSNYGVSANSSGQLRGFAWGSDVVGWVSFSSADCDADNNGFIDSGACGGDNSTTAVANYGATADPSTFNSKPDKPTIPPPTIPPTYGPDGITWDNCTFKGKSTPTFNWTYSDPDGDLMQAYEIEVDDDAAFGAPKFNHLVNLPSTAYALNLYDDDEDPDDLPFSMQDYELDWDTQYFWQVRVQDSVGNWSGWSNSQGFKPPKHAYPWVDFTWLPTEPTQKETVEFNPDASEVYDGLPISDYLWSITQGTGDFVEGTNAVFQYPNIQFSTLNNKVSLQITDSDSYSCAKEKDLTAELPLPEYKEIPPIIWLKKILAGLSALWNWL